MGVCMRERFREQEDKSLSYVPETINSPWEAMFLSQTAAGTASWSETQGEKKKHSQPNCLSSLSPSIIPSFYPAHYQPSSWICSSVKARHANSSSSHTKTLLSVAASNYLGEEGQGSGALGGEKRQEGGRSSYAFLHWLWSWNHTLQESKHWQWQERSKASEGD